MILYFSPTENVDISQQKMTSEIKTFISRNTGNNNSHRHRYVPDPSALYHNLNDMVD